MALLKKCNHCSEKGFFLKLTNGLCDNCKLIVENLENDYTTLLQKIALTPDNLKSAIEDLNILISKAKPFDGISNVSISVYESLLSTLSEKEKNSLSNDNTIKNISISSNTNKISNNIKVKPINLKLNSIKTTNESLKKNMNIDDIIFQASPSKIKNLIEPLLYQDISNELINTSKTLKLNITSSGPSKKSSSVIEAPTLNLDSSSNKYKTQIKFENKTSSIIEPPSIKDTFIINNLKKKCSLLISKLDDSNTTVDSIAENYFYIKNELLPDLNTNSNFLNENPDIQKSLENAKNTLCIRSKKTEEELFNFFNYVTIFVQTTGLSPKNSDIIEISAAKVSYGKIVDEFYSLINPIKSIKISVTNSTGISNKDVEDKPTIDMIIRPLVEFIGDYQLVAFNPKPIELFINSTLKKLNMPLINKPVISVRNLYRIRYKNYYGYQPTLSDLSSTCTDLLPSKDIDYINQFDSLSLSTSHATYKVYEILKYKYK